MINVSKVYSTTMVDVAPVIVRDHGVELPGVAAPGNVTSTCWDGSTESCGELFKRRVVCAYEELRFGFCLDLVVYVCKSRASVAATQKPAFGRLPG